MIGGGWQLETGDISAGGWGMGSGGFVNEFWVRRKMKWP